MSDDILAERIDQLSRRIDRLEHIAAALVYILKETEDFWPYTTPAQQELANQLETEVAAAGELLREEEHHV